MVFQCRIFEVLDARIASALIKIIHNSQFKRRISLEEQKAQEEDRFLRGRQIAYLIYEQFRVTGTHDSVENYTDLFTIALRNDDIQEFDSKWDGILLSMTKIPPGNRDLPFLGGNEFEPSVHNHWKEFHTVRRKVRDQGHTSLFREPFTRNTSQRKSGGH